MSKLPDLSQFDHATVLLVDPKLATRTRITPDTIGDLATTYAVGPQKPGWTELTQIVGAAPRAPGAPEPFEVRTGVVFTGPGRKPLTLYLQSHGEQGALLGYLDGEAYTLNAETATALANWTIRFSPTVVSHPQTAAMQ